MSDQFCPECGAGTVKQMAPRVPPPKPCKHHFILLESVPSPCPNYESRFYCQHCLEARVVNWEDAATMKRPDKSGYLRLDFTKREVVIVDTSYVEVASFEMGKTVDLVDYTNLLVTVKETSGK